MTPPVVTSCVGLAGSSLSVCQFLQAQSETCAINQYRNFTTMACQNYTSAVDKVAAELGSDATMNTGNTAWMLLSAALVMLMTPGLALFYGGLSGQNSANNTIMMCWAALTIVTLQWFLFGYSFAFGPGNNAFGSFQWACLINVTGLPSGAYGWQIPHYVYVAFQNMFAMITPAIIAGAVVGRMKFVAFCVFVLVWTTVVYDPIAHWVWSLTITPDFSATVALGWLGVLGEADFAGGTVIHVSSGFAGLACALIIGKRKDYGPKLRPHNIPMVLIGAIMLWFGWFGFNAGSAGGAANVPIADGGLASNSFVNNLASFALINTHLATAMAALSWNVCEKIVDKAPTVAGGASGMVAGLVAITPACGFIEPWLAVVLGLVVSPICFAAVSLKNFLQVDDTLDCWGIHGIGGFVGAFWTGLAASPRINPAYVGAFYGRGIMLGYQMAGITVAASFSFFLSLAIMVILDKTIGVRLSAEQEEYGPDMSEHGQKAYDIATPPKNSATTLSEDTETGKVDRVEPAQNGQPADGTIGENKITEQNGGEAKLPEENAASVMGIQTEGEKLDGSTNANGTSELGEQSLQIV